MMLWVVSVHAASTLMMAGLVWFVQVVHYPLFALVGTDASVAYERAHQRRTTWVVAPLMLLELASAVVIALQADGMRWLALIGLALLAVAWASTWLVQVPCHRRLESGLDARVVHRLVRSNWIRTTAWTARGAIALWMMVGMTA